MKRLWITVVLAVLVMGVIWVAGCRKSAPAGSAIGAPRTTSAPPAGVGTTATTPAAATVYTCPMHPEVTSDRPGKCPKCRMNLVPKQK